MRTLIVSDVHSNLEALEAVIADAEAGGGFGRVWCLGDTVGYGPEPGGCLARLRQFPLLAVAGNHDWAATGQIDADDFNGYARAAVIWTAQQLTADERAFLSGLPEVAESAPFTLAHGSLREPLREYLFRPADTLDTFAMLETAYCLVGHTHYPAIFRESGGPAGGELPQWEAPPHGWRTPLTGPRCIINPGSVGQPRDHDSRAAYAVYDDGGNGGEPAIEHRRVAYDIAATQEKMQRAGLPEFLIERLELGR